ncbi:MAG: hypothetical protein KIS77_18215 [Saprospiraceae bacterium]|nr:hypothetical protein [Saprospiraceae bacterium]
MKNHIVALLALLAFTFMVACEDSKGPSVQPNNFTLTFRATYDGQPLEKYKNYPYGDKVVTFDRFNTYLSDITLLSGAVETKLSDIEWVDFTPDDATNNDAVEVSFKYTVPDGDYTGIKIGYGVKANLNAKRPSDFPPSHPLYIESEYWLGWKSYIFTKVQGRVDLDANDTTETVIFYHCGSDPVYNMATMSAPIDVRGTSSLVVEFDLKKLFTFDGALLDLEVPSNRTTSHDASNIALAQKLMMNFKNATSMK